MTRDNPLPRILGIETSRGLCSAAVLVDGKVSEHTRRMPKAHNEHILALADAALAGQGLLPGELDGVAFGCGPGSFTGIRIAASVAQAVAFAAQTPILRVSSTLALASAALERAPAIGNGIVASIRSRRDAWYLAAFAVVDGELLPRHQDCLAQTDPGWPEIAQGWRFVGDRPVWLSDAIECREDVFADAGLIARLGADALARQEGVAPELGLPVYLAADSPWRKLGRG